VAAGAGWFPVVQPAGLTDATGAAASAAPAACEVGVAQRRTGTYNAHWPSGAAATRPRSGAGCTSTPRDSTPWSAPRPNGLDKPGRWSRPNSTIPRPLPTTTPVAQAVRPMLAAGQRPGPRRASGLALWAKRAEGPSRRGDLASGPAVPTLVSWPLPTSGPPPPARGCRDQCCGGWPWKQPFRPVRPGVWHPCHQLAVLQRREPRHTSASVRVLLPWPRA